MTALLFVRRYRSEDRTACLALFESNIPAFFIEKERTMFAGFLDKMPGIYVVVEDAAGHRVASGGLAILDGGEASLCWGFVDFRRHRQGLGTALLRVRMALAARLPGIIYIGAKTSNQNAPFFEREGMYPVRVIDNYFRPSLHIRCELDLARRATIEARLSALLSQGLRLEEGLLETAPMIPLE
jgi:ribosomal protein S18 acetylase RimI-like enzyme